MMAYFEAHRNRRTYVRTNEIVLPINFVFAGFSCVIYSRSISLIEIREEVEEEDDEKTK